MQKFSIRSLLIFVMCLVVAVLLIGLCVAAVVKFKQRDVSNNTTNEPQQPPPMSADARVLLFQPWVNDAGKAVLHRPQHRVVVEWVAGRPVPEPPPWIWIGPTGRMNLPRA